MNSEEEFQMEFETNNGEFDFFDPTDFQASSTTRKLFTTPFETEKSETFKFFEYLKGTTSFLNEKKDSTFNVEENSDTAHFDFIANESFDDEIQIVPNENEQEVVIDVPTQPSGNAKKENIGGFRFSQTPGTSTNFVTLEPNESSICQNSELKPKNGSSLSENKISRDLQVPVVDISESHWEPEVLIAKEGNPLEPISRIPLDYRSVFDGYIAFNMLQSLAFNVVFTTDRPVVISAPTSSGKTVIFEIAIIRLLTASGCKNIEKQKVLFMAPTKAVVNEKFRDWESKFSKFGIKCLEVTGDTELEDYKVLEKASIIFTTPEKWDSLTRKSQEISQVVNTLRLVLIDEVHCLNDDGRGATMEVVISRMKTINQRRKGQKMRFIAVSATIPNADDIALWLGTYESKTVVCILPSDMRPVRLQNVVLGYYSSDSQNDFQFEKKLSYKVPDVIQKYSSGKPSLIFVPTRTSAITTAQQIIKSPITHTFVNDVNQKRELIALSNKLQERNLKELVTRGIGFHHAGLSYNDRTLIMEAFSTGRIKVLCCTTTLALGVNVPAHLVIIKSTFHYIMGVCSDLPESQVLQMIGRAGRPQFDTAAVAVIMTKEKLKSKYEKMLNGTQVIESFLHKHLAEHINAEIVLQTITDVTVACEWIQSTFLYIRIMKNRAYYGIDASRDKKAVEKKLQEWCIKELNGLKKFNLITMDEDCAGIKSTEIGKVMSRYCISVDSMKKFMKLRGNETIKELLELVASCEEVTQEMRLRNPEKNQLNSFNEPSKNEPHKELVRYQLKGKIKTPKMKANCLIQVMLGNMKIDDHSLYQDSKRVFKSGQRVTKCMLEYLMIEEKGFHLLVNGSLLAKSFRAGIWEDSPYVTRQLSIQSKEVSVNVSRDIAAGGLTSFEAIESALPQIVEMFAKKLSPYGKLLQNVIKKLPRYELTMEQLSRENTDDDDDDDYFVTLQVNVSLKNLQQIRNDYDDKHSTSLIVGNFDNEILHKRRLYDKILVRNNGEFQAEVKCRPSQIANKVLVRLVSESIVGIDVYRDFYPQFDDTKVSKYFSTANRRIKLPPNNPNMPKELKFFERWKHLCSRDCEPKHLKRGINGNVSLAPSVRVESVKRKKCEIGPMDRFIDNRQPQVVQDDDEMMSDPEFDALLANYEFPEIKIE